MKGLKSCSIILGVGLAVTLLVLGTKALKKGIDETTAVVTAPPKYAYGEVVSLKLSDFYKYCNKVGVITDYSHGIYTIENVICKPPGLYEETRTFKLNGSSIIGIAKEKN